MTDQPTNIRELRARANQALDGWRGHGAQRQVNVRAAELAALLDLADAAHRAAQIDADLQRIRGIADADGGRLLGEYGFTTIRDALFNISQAQGHLDDALARFTFD